MKKTVLEGAVLVIIIIAAFGLYLYAKNTGNAAEETIKIGAIMPLTGEGAEIGARSREAVEMAISEINNAGGISGKKLEVIYEDGKCNAKDAAEAANKLVNLDNVHVIVGGLCSGETLAAAPISEQNKVVMLSPCSSAPKVSEAGDYIFRDYPSDTFQGSFAAEYIYNVLGKRKVATLNTIGDWGTGIKDKFKQRFVQLGGTIVAEENFEQTAADMRGQLTKIKAAQPDVIYMPAYPQGTSLILKQGKELGINAQFFGADASDDPVIIEGAGSAAEGYMFTVADPGSGTFAQRFNLLYGHDPIVCTTYSYDAANILAMVMKKAGTSSEAIKNELYNVRNYQGETGSISFDENGDRTTADYIIKKVADGAFTTLAA